MAKPIIEVENLSKLYRIGVIGPTTLRDSVERWWYRTRGREEMCQKIGAKHLMIEPDAPQAGPEPNTLWALKDISFSVQRGEIIGIIGKNGVGKTTLLKILTRITEPTSGRAVIRGRTSSMLEVGTGFHPELTGRENIYLNGAILGMRKTEIDRKLDEIVDFSGVEKFIDTPVKRYSSGMYVRLAFSVAAHLEPEILIVDEVLAVGDAMFREKCLGKMNKVATEGRTVLFVSHSMKAIEMLCNRVILLNNGKIVLEGNSSEVVQYYLGGKENKVAINENADRHFSNDPSKPAQINRLRIFDNHGQLSTKHNILNPIKIVVAFELRIDYPTLFVECVFRRVEGNENGSFLTTNYDWQNYKKDRDGHKMTTVFAMQPGKYSATINLPAPLLNVGIYEIELYLTTGPFRQDTCRNILFELVDTGSFASVVRNANRGGMLAFPLKWEIKKV
jgi:lipopolysaccharide transport system ATP-binding protein